MPVPKSTLLSGSLSEDENAILSLASSFKQKILYKVKKSEIISYLRSKEFAVMVTKFLPNLVKLIKAEKD